MVAVDGSGCSVLPRISWFLMFLFLSIEEANEETLTKESDWHEPIVKLERMEDEECSGTER